MKNIKEYFLPILHTDFEVVPEDPQKALIATIVFGCDSRMICRSEAKIGIKGSYLHLDLENCTMPWDQESQFESKVEVGTKISVGKSCGLGVKAGESSDLNIQSATDMRSELSYNLIYYKSHRQGGVDKPQWVFENPGREMLIGSICNERIGNIECTNNDFVIQFSFMAPKSWLIVEPATHVGHVLEKLRLTSCILAKSLPVHAKTGHAILAEGNISVTGAQMRHSHTTGGLSHSYYFHKVQEPLEKLLSCRSNKFSALAAAAGLDIRHDLAGADLSGTNLEGVDFSHADLRGTKFTGANVKFASFRNANITKAVFDFDSIRLADFRGAKGLRLSLGMFANSKARLNEPKSLKVSRAYQLCRIQSEKSCVKVTGVKSQAVKCGTPHSNANVTKGWHG